MAESMIDRMAKAMCESDGFSWMAASQFATANGETPEEQRDYWRDKPCDAIKAMYEPTDAIMASIADVSPNYTMPETRKRIWQAAIKAAFNEQVAG
jgi:hypothetical protein